MGRVAEIFFNLNSAETNDKIQSLAHSISPLLTEYGNDIMLNQNLFQKVKHVYDKRQELNLGMEETMLLDKTYLGFTRNGALLNDEDKNTLREIDKKS